MSEREIGVLDKGFVRLVDVMGDDQSIVRAARVSYGQGSKGDEADKKLINYLIKNRHTSPFESVTFTFHVKAPIFVFRQWHRHRTWSYNELSARYTEMKDEFYSPAEWRAQDTKNKQGSVIPLHNDALQYTSNLMYASAVLEAYKIYETLLAGGVAREMARMVLPVSLYSEMYATVDLHNLFHFLSLRLDPHAQYEIRVYAEAMVELITPHVPWAVTAWKERYLK